MSRPITRRTLLRAGAAGASTWLGGLRFSDLAQAVPRSSAARFVPQAAGAASSPDDLAYLTIAQASAMITKRSISPVDLVEACLDRIERFEPEIKAWVSVFASRAHAQARSAAKEIARSGPRSPLHGIPIGMKDIFDIKGLPTRCGSNVRADVAPAARDATVVARLKQAGAILLGKTNLQEFADGGATPPTSNPWDTSRIPGGSSGGSAAALAAGMCHGGTGTDTAGSIRMPAALCNLVGLKATYGRVSRAGVFPLAWTLDHAGPLARSVEDCALLLNAMAGPDPRDPTTAPGRAPDFTAGLGGSIKGRTIGVPTSIFFDGADEETARLVRKAIPVFRSLGAKVVDVEMPSTQEIALIIWLLVGAVESYSVHEHYIRTQPQDYKPPTLAVLALGSPWLAQHYLRAQRIRTINIREWVDVFAGVDAVLSPTTPRPAPPKTEAQMVQGFDLVNYTLLFDVNGCPSVSVPAGFTSEGLPVGLMLSARPFDEARLLQLAYAYQQATGFAARRPPLMG